MICNLRCLVLQVNLRIVQNDILVRFIQVSSHIGAKGNEEVDKLVKQALQKEIIKIQVQLSKSEVKVLIWNKAIEECQVTWYNRTS